jgi:hypothetical protein
MSDLVPNSRTARADAPRETRPGNGGAQRTPQPVFTEHFAYDPAAPSQLLGKWRISPQLHRELQR